MAKALICPNCGTTGLPKTFTKGSILMELCLWLLFLIPGLIYSLWRISSRYKGCRQCGATNLVPLDSPRGKQLASELGTQP